jgi:hypothetical protein
VEPETDPAYAIDQIDSFLMTIGDLQQNDCENPDNEREITKLVINIRGLLRTNFKDDDKKLKDLENDRSSYSTKHFSDPDDAITRQKNYEYDLDIIKYHLIAYKTELESIDNSRRKADIEENEPNSVIKYLFDQFGITHIFKNIGDKTSWEITWQLNDALILFIFLFFTFFVSKLITWDLLSPPMLILGILLLFLITEFVGANTSFFKGLFFSEEKANYFLRNFTTNKTTDIEKELQNLNFSPKNVQLLLEIIMSDKKKIPSYVVDEILTKNSLSPENINTIFSTIIRSYELRRDLIIDLLIKYQNQLSSDNLDNLYTKYKNDKQIVKLIFTTQIDSHSLINKESTNEEFIRYYESFQNNRIIRSEKNKLIEKAQIKSSGYRLVALIILWPTYSAMLLIVGFVFLQLPISLWPLIVELSIICSLLIMVFLFKTIINPYISEMKEIARQKILDL